ncbi:MAG: class I SAM-dependent methyltransferase, partial [Prevotellaceae bacterium]|nr:class I SAM-dependent methyltransferase [Prevotellaceae bacterium]
MADLLCAVLDKTSRSSLNIVDVGCGDAFFLHRLSERFVSCNFFAVDTAFTPDTIAAFEEKYKGTSIKFYHNLAEFDNNYNKITTKLQQNYNKITTKLQQNYNKITTKLQQNYNKITTKL